MSDWCILRTKGGNTLKLTESLRKAQFEVWTPCTQIRRRVPRAKARIEQSAPLTPTFVFARATHLLDLISLADSPMNPHPAFSVFRYFGSVPLLADDDLNGLRISEARKVPSRKRKQFTKGDLVRVTEGIFAGMSGIVESAKGQFSVVMFDKRVKVATFLLHPGERLAA